MSKILNVAIIGQGRSGRDIHGKFFLTDYAKTLFKVTACVDFKENRRKKAQELFNCDVYEDYRDLFKRNDIDLVVNSTYSYMHCKISDDLLNHGFNVISEKPFSKYVMECEKTVALAKKNNCVFSVFQQSRFAPYYLRIKEIIDSGVLGKIYEIHAFNNGYARRWDWQCSNRYYGGALLNTGPHTLDHALQFLETDDMPNVCSWLKKINSAGDAEDYAKVILTYPDKPLIEIDINCADAYNGGVMYKISGDRGSLISTVNNIKYKYFDEKPMPKLQLESLTTEDGITPAYCSEKLNWHEFEETLEGTAFDVGTKGYYTNIYNHIVNGEDLTVKPEKVVQQIRVAELVHAQNPMITLY